jgi:hypothetical protein
MRVYPWISQPCAASVAAHCCPSANYRALLHIPRVVAGLWRMMRKILRRLAKFPSLPFREPTARFVFPAVRRQGSLFIGFPFSLLPRLRSSFWKQRDAFPHTRPGQLLSTVMKILHTPDRPSILDMPTRLEPRHDRRRRYPWTSMTGQAFTAGRWALFGPIQSAEPVQRHPEGLAKSRGGCGEGGVFEMRGP